MYDLHGFVDGFCKVARVYGQPENPNLMRGLSVGVPTLLFAGLGAANAAALKPEEGESRIGNALRQAAVSGMLGAGLGLGGRAGAELGARLAPDSLLTNLGLTGAGMVGGALAGGTLGMKGIGVPRAVQKYVDTQVQAPEAPDAVRARFRDKWRNKQAMPSFDLASPHTMALMGAGLSTPFGTARGLEMPVGEGESRLGNTTSEALRATLPAVSGAYLGEGALQLAKRYGKGRVSPLAAWFAGNGIGIVGATGLYDAAVKRPEFQRDANEAVKAMWGIAPAKQATAEHVPFPDPFVPLPTETGRAKADAMWEVLKARNALPGGELRRPRLNPFVSPAGHALRGGAIGAGVGALSGLVDSEEHPILSKAVSTGVGAGVGSALGGWATGRGGAWRGALGGAGLGLLTGVANDMDPTRIPHDETWSPVAGAVRGGAIGALGGYSAGHADRLRSLLSLATLKSAPLQRAHLAESAKSGPLHERLRPILERLQAQRAKRPLNEYVPPPPPKQLAEGGV